MRKIIFSIYFLSIIGCKNENNTLKEVSSSRIVCISKQYTEIIYALEAEKNLVAVDLSSSYPKAAKQLPNVGYHRALSAEAILAQKPTLILEDNNIGPEHVVEQLKKLKIPMIQFGEYSKSIKGVESLINEIGHYFNKEKEAKLITKKLKSDMDIALKSATKYKKKTKVLIIHYGQASNVFLVMTNSSVGAKMVEWAGGTLAINDKKGMKHLSSELVASSDPDVILMTDFGYDKFKGSYDKLKELPGISSTKAFKNKRIFRIEEHDLVYLGPRTGENVLLIQELIHKNEN